jgi:transposase
VKFRGIVLLAEEGHSVQSCCELFDVSTSGYYDWKSRGPSARSKANESLKTQIKEIHKDSKGTYGSPRIKASLERQGQKVGEDRVAKLMREENIRARQKKAFVPKTTVNNPEDKKSERLFKIGKSSAWHAISGRICRFQGQILGRSKNISLLMNRVNNISEVVPRVNFIKLAAFH